MQPGLRRIVAAAMAAMLCVSAIAAGICVAEPVFPDAGAWRSSSTRERAPSFLSRHRGRLLWTAGLTAAGAGVTAVVVRRRANDRFADYEQAAEPQRIAELYDETAHLDNISAAFFVLAEVSFLAAMYLGFFVEPASAVRAAGGGGEGARGGATAPAALTLAPTPGGGLALTWRW